MTRAAEQMRDPKAALYGCFYLGLLYSQQRDVVEAERYFRKTLSLAPNFIEATTSWAARSGSPARGRKQRTSGSQAMARTASASGGSAAPRRSGCRRLAKSRPASPETPR